MELDATVPLSQVLPHTTNHRADLSRPVEAPAFACTTLSRRRAQREFDEKHSTSSSGKPAAGTKPALLNVGRILDRRPSMPKLTAAEAAAEQQADMFRSIAAAISSSSDGADESGADRPEWAVEEAQAAAQSSAAAAANDADNKQLAHLMSRMHEGEKEEEDSSTSAARRLPFQLTARARLPVDRFTSVAVSAARQQLHDDAWAAIVAFHRAVVEALRPTDIDPAAAIAEAMGGKGTAARRKTKRWYSHPTAGDGVPEPLWELLTGGHYILPLLRSLLERAAEVSPVTGSGFIVDRAGFIASVKAVLAPLIEPRIEAGKAALAEIVRLQKIAARRSSAADYNAKLLGDGVLAPPPRDPLLARSEGGAKLLQGATSSAAAAAAGKR